MSETKARANAGADKAIDERIASLMGKIQAETVPERLLELARQLQAALNAQKK
ncbi:MAG TPA: hypothetical protein VD840_17090 [Sinorhizobium sp.]|nr:hypothetical protein [Sinorhizobium sp.]